MAKEVKVLIREDNTHKTVLITDKYKPSIDSALVSKWQSSLNDIAKLLDVPSALIMIINEDYMKVLVKSNNKGNPYEAGGADKLGHGLYCETVIGTDNELQISNALKSEIWKDNPDIKLGMISYYGLPIKWSDGTFFGTICVLDKKENKYSSLFKTIMKEQRDIIESDLHELENNEKLKHQ